VIDVILLRFVSRQGASEASLKEVKAAVAEAGVPVTQSKQFTQLKAMLDKKNTQLNDVRRRLAKWVLCVVLRCVFLNG
jgi:hypothetical protein